MYAVAWKSAIEPGVNLGRVGILTASLFGGQAKDFVALAGKQRYYIDVRYIVSTHIYFESNLEHLPLTFGFGVSCLSVASVGPT